MDNAPHFYLNRIRIPGTREGTSYLSSDRNSSPPNSSLRAACDTSRSLRRGTAGRGGLCCAQPHKKTKSGFKYIYPRNGTAVLSGQGCHRHDRGSCHTRGCTKTGSGHHHTRYVARTHCKPGARQLHHVLQEVVYLQNCCLLSLHPEGQTPTAVDYQVLLIVPGTRYW